MKVTGRRISVWIAVGIGALLLLSGPVAAQIPDELSNLQVLPKDMGKREVVNIMRNFAGALGVRCTHCHAGEEGAALKDIDFASDDKEAKNVARGMMKMAQEINDKLLPASGLDSSHGISCVTCHRGVAHPKELTDILMEQIEEGGAEAAVAGYRELREEHYGSAAYDFSAGTLNNLAETLAREKQDLDSAVTLLELNIEFQDTAYTRLMLAQLYAMKSDLPTAKGHAERAAELEPDNPMAKQMLKRLNAGE